PSPRGRRWDPAFGDPGLLQGGGADRVAVRDEEVVEHRLIEDQGAAKTPGRRGRRDAGEGVLEVDRLGQRAELARAERSVAVTGRYRVAGVIDDRQADRQGSGARVQDDALGKVLEVVSEDDRRRDLLDGIRRAAESEHGSGGRGKDENLHDTLLMGM